MNVDYIASDDIEIYGLCSSNKPKKYCVTWVKNIEKSNLETFDVSRSYIIVAKEQIPIKKDVLIGENALVDMRSTVIKM